MSHPGTKNFVHTQTVTLAMVGISSKNLSSSWPFPTPNMYLPKDNPKFYYNLLTVPTRLDPLTLAACC